MTTTIVPDLVQTLPLLLTATSNSAQREDKGVSSPDPGTVSTKAGKPNPVDTVSISYQSQQSITDVKKVEGKKEEINKVIYSEKSDRTFSRVQFVYNPKGDLSIRYMDTASRLIYQTPSELMLRLEEAATKSNSSVDTNA